MCVVIVTRKSNSTYSWFDLIALPCLPCTNRSGTSAIRQKKVDFEHIAVLYALPITSVMILCKPLEYVCIYKRYRQISSLILPFVIFHLMVWFEARRLKNTNTHTYTCSLICVNARFIRVQFSMDAEGQRRKERIHWRWRKFTGNERVTNSIWKITQPNVFGLFSIWMYFSPFTMLFVWLSVTVRADWICSNQSGMEWKWLHTLIMYCVCLVTYQMWKQQQQQRRQRQTYTRSTHTTTTTKYDTLRIRGKVCV